eukprot:s573_g24.t1
MRYLTARGLVSIGAIPGRREIFQDHHRATAGWLGRSRRVEGDEMPIARDTLLYLRNCAWSPGSVTLQLWSPAHRDTETRVRVTAEGDFQTEQAEDCCDPRSILAIIDGLHSIQWLWVLVQIGDEVDILTFFLAPCSRSCAACRRGRCCERHHPLAGDHLEGRPGRHTQIKAPEGVGRAAVGEAVVVPQQGVARGSPEAGTARKTNEKSWGPRLVTGRRGDPASSILFLPQPGEGQSDAQTARTAKASTGTSSSFMSGGPGVFLLSFFDAIGTAALATQDHARIVHILGKWTWQRRGYAPSIFRML